MMVTTGMARIQAAFSPGGAGEIPVVIPYERIYIRDHWSALTCCPWWYAESPELAQQLAWQGDVIQRIGQDWCEVTRGQPRAVRGLLAIEVRGDSVYRVDRRSGREELLRPPQVSGWSKVSGVVSVHADRLPATREEIDAAIPLGASPNGAGYSARWPDPELLRSDGSADVTVALFQGPARGLCPLHSVSSPLWDTYNLWGFEGMMVMVAERPDLVEYACRRLLERALHSVRCSAALGAKAIWIEDCMTDMINGRAFARLNVPFIKEIVAGIRAEGMWSIHYFCGNPAGKWELLFSTGADALSLEEGKKGFAIDIEEVVERAGRGAKTAVLGNLDAVGVLQEGSEEELRREIARQIAAGRRNGGRFIMSLGSPVTPETPVERVRLYCDLAHELGA